MTDSTKTSIGLLLGMLSILVSLTVPEIRIFVGLEDEEIIDSGPKEKDEIEDKTGAHENRNLEIFTWEEHGMYTNVYEGIYDSKKYSKSQLQNTFDLLSRDSKRFKRGTWFLKNYAEIIDFESQFMTIEKFRYNQRFDIDAIDQYYTKQIIDLDTSKFVLSEKIETIRKRRQKLLKQDWEIERTKVLAFSKKDALLAIENLPECLKYAKAISQGGNRLLETWKDWYINSQKKKFNPHLMRKFEKEWSSSQSLHFAKLAIIDYGWYNCMNISLQTSDEYGEFKNLFIDYKLIATK